MIINWQTEVLKRKEDLLRDLKSMLQIQSVRDETLATKSAPLGPGPKKALDNFLEIGKRDGFETLELDGLAGHIAYGQGDETLAILGHVDVMPAGKGWNTDPFVPTIKDGRLYARGASDDKGPSMAAYYGLKIVKELGLPINKKIRFILGTDEESQWRGMTHYFDKMPAPDFGFSPDAFFPIINGEKGNVTFVVKFEGDNKRAPIKLLHFEAGLRENMVPRDASAIIVAGNYNEIADDFNKFVQSNPISGEIHAKNEKIVLELIGKAAHAQEPKNGENAGTYLAKFLQKYELAGDAKDFIDFAANYLHLDSRMKKMDAAFSDEIMGDLTMNAGIFNFDEESTNNTITLNFRFPKGMDENDIRSSIDKVTSKMNVSLEQGRVQVPHYVSPKDPLVKTLLDVYQRQTGQKAQGMVVGGGTYGRLMERGVAFGAMFPGVPDTMHQANEFIPVDDVLKAAAIYAEAIYELTK